MESLCIVSCGKKKIWDKNPNAGPTEAKSVYIGPFVKKCREYAEKFYLYNWMILSAKYGFLEPTDTVPISYDVCFHDKKSNSISIEDLKKQINEKDLDKYDKVIVLCGKFYTKIIGDVLSQKEIYNPLKGCKDIGHMIVKLNSFLEDKNENE